MHEAAVEHLSKADPVLARLIRRVGPCRLARKNTSPFQALVHSVAHQQLNGTAANTILKRVIGLYPGRKFPAPEGLLATPDRRLGGARPSRGQVAALKKIAPKKMGRGVPPFRALAERCHAGNTQAP